MTITPSPQPPNRSPSPYGPPAPGRPSHNNNNNNNAKNRSPTRPNAVSTKSVISDINPNNDGTNGINGVLKSNTHGGPHRPSFSSDASAIKRGIVQTSTSNAGSSSSGIASADATPTPPAATTTTTASGIGGVNQQRSGAATPVSLPGVTSASGAQTTSSASATPITSGFRTLLPRSWSRTSGNMEDVEGVAEKSTSMMQLPWSASTTSTFESIRCSIQDQQWSSTLSGKH